MNTEKIKKDFPVFNRHIIYMDSAATSQKPSAVIDAMNDFYMSHNANVHRGVHTLSSEATEMYETSRKKISSFISASPKEIIFTKNATESINLVSHSLKLRKGDEIVSTVMEHHSNIVPWQMLGPDIKVRFADINDDGTLDMGSLEELINENTRLVTAMHSSNVLGTINDARKISGIAHAAGSLFLLDASQSVPHMPVDARKIDADFIAFSGHKMCGPMGIGVLYGKHDALEEMKPFMGGGDMIKEVTLEKTKYNDVPYKFEAGTPNVGGAVGLGAAIDYLNGIGMDNVLKHEEKLAKYCINVLEETRGIRILGKAKDRIGVISFNLEGVHSHDVASIVNEDGIAIRSGHHCAMPLMRRLGVNDACRASFYIYNSEEEIDKLASSLQKARKIFGE